MKEVKITLQEAEELWKEYKLIKERDLTAFEAVCLRHISRTFSAEELEEKEGYTWEESHGPHGVEGWVISDKSEIRKCAYVGPAFDDGKCAFKTKEQAESALAFSQLTHIVAKYNEGKAKTNSVYAVGPYNSGLDVFGRHHEDVYFNLCFLKREDAELSMKTNRQLWIDYWQLNHLKDKT